MGHPDDIAVAHFGINRLQYEGTGNFLMYDRATQQTIIPPQMHRYLNPQGEVTVDYDYPGGYIKGGVPAVTFGLDVPTLNNLQASYWFQIWFSGEPYSFESPVQTLQGGLSNTVTCPQLPNYVYAHHFRIVIRIWFWFPNDRVWVPYSSWEYNPVFAPPALDWTNYWYAVFDDPNMTPFPPYPAGGSGSLQTVPWYHIIENALNHVTKSGADQTVTQEAVGMRNLTTDLYVWNPSLPNNGRPNGPGSSIYAPYWPPFGNLHYRYRESEDAVVFSLWAMKLNSSGDCRDFAAFLESEARSLGISGVAKRRLGIPYGDGFNTNPVIPCGSSFPGTQSFTYHQMTSWSGGIYDFAIAFNYSDGVHPWKLATGSPPGSPPPPGAPGTEYRDLVASPWTPSNPPDWSIIFALGEEDPIYDVTTWVE